MTQAPLHDKLLALLSRTTSISPTIEREDRRDGGERYIVKGVPCGFPVATFGDANDAALFVFAATELEAELTRNTAIVDRLAEMLSMFVDAAKPRRQDGYHEMPMFSATEIALAREALATLRTSRGDGE